MNNQAHDQTVYVLSYIDTFDYEMGQHILGFYSSEEKTKEAIENIERKGLQLPFSVRSKTIKDIVEGAIKARDDWADEKEYPWTHCYTSAEEIAALLDSSKLVDKLFESLEERAKRKNKLL